MAKELEREGIPGGHGKMVEKELEMVAEHKADSRYRIVGAASIMAKVERDREIERLKERYGDFGPGYPSNAKTISWLNSWFAKHHSFPEIVRESWDTIAEIRKAADQSKLSSFLGKLKKDKPC